MKNKIIDKLVIEKIAKLARLEIDGKMEDKLTGQLSEIVDYFSQLSRISTEKLKPLFNITETENVFREDICSKSFNQNDALMNVKEKHKGLIKVKAVLEKNYED